MKILLKELDSKGFAMARENDKRAGMMTYSIAGTELIIIDHTEVEPEFKGKGVGKQLLYKIVEMAREKNIKILPLCPFAAMMFKKLDDIKDVLKS
ncbi:MAG: GNAT family N-acetyltransferase [Flavobacterium sp. MedPE-SWcel]|uniref:GNAT family N-acetyltransferase n=1 Tax=uncultured Flavobacterium sp. TaxID=165435 RepID=UPI00091C7D49|nr:GNAT family N-acetyltransferase [uncultured Flavobacterium sp.]OIQ15339.1 MAG: GNAT family N-acetyltransferase [Flavobacterium sp. MedPE-SWcel]